MSSLVPNPSIKRDWRKLSSGNITVRHIAYGEDKDRRFHPKEEKIVFENQEKLIEWIKERITKETNGVLYG
jgi:hypothetical protein